MRRTLAAVFAFGAVSCSIASGVTPSQPPPQSPPGLGTAGCPVPGELTPPGALMLFRNDGCVPPEELMGFRCAPDEPVVIEIGAGTREAERFIGERWATPLEALPPGAFPLGDGGDIQVYGMPGDEKTLIVARDDTVERWLRLPRLGASDPPTAFVIGDSIADGAEPWILEALPNWTIGFDAVIGRGTNSAVTSAESQAPLGPDVVVVELGTNDADPVAFRENGVTILDALKHVPLVVWQTAHGPLVNIPGVNIHIHGLVPQYPNAVVADWDTFVNDDELSADGVHPAPGHEDLMANLIAPILTRWLEVADGGGASACASQAENAAGVP